MSRDTKNAGFAFIYSIMITVGTAAGAAAFF